MSFLDRLLGKPPAREALAPLYAAIVAEARAPAWYTLGAVPDTQDGRFDMIAALMSLVLIRLERGGEALAGESALLAEQFIADMDGQLRQIGIGDVVVGKHVGRMMGALGGRLVAYREGLNDDGDMRAPLVRNLYRGEAPGEAALAFAESRLRAIAAGLDALAPEAIVAGALAPR